MPATMARPTWAAFWNAYPDYWNFPDSGAVKASIGGAVDGDWIANTCAVRLSAALNATGVTVPGNRAGLLTVKGADGKRYALRVAEVRKWLPVAIGPPDFDRKKKPGEPFDSSALSAYKGIIAFDVSFSDATGHLDAWTGSVFSNEHKAGDYWARASRVTLWKLG